MNIEYYLVFFSQGEFTTIIELAEGTHEFKYLVDGSWKTAANEVCYVLKHYLLFH